MSKFFNETVKARNSITQEPGLTLDGLEDVPLADKQKDVQVVDESEPRRLDAFSSRKIAMPESVLLSSKFQGSGSLRSAEEAYRVLRTRLLRMRATRELRSVVLTSSVPGEGKTLTSLNLALSCSQLQNLRVLLIDGDIRTGGLSRSLGIMEFEGLADVLSGRCDPGAVVLETDHPNLYVCGAGTSALPPAELYAGDEWRECIESWNKSFDILLIDGPPILNLSDVELMTVACDGVLLVVRASHTRREVLQRSSNQVDAKKFLGLVYNFSEGAHHKFYYAS